jgi:transposase
MREDKNMTRPTQPDSGLRVSVHVANGYRYASTQPGEIDKDTGRKVYRHIHWGRVDDGNRFIPGKTYLLASPETRNSLIFPEEWDMSEAGILSGARKPGRPAYTGEDENRLYGDIWLLEQVAAKTGMRQDLEKVFEGNTETVDTIMTLAMFPYLTKYSYNRTERWQRITRTPSDLPLSSAYITRFTQSIGEQHRMELLRLRAARVGKNEILAVDSTSRSAYGDTLADIHWGRNKERLPLPQTTEVVVYTLDRHEPVYYRTFPGNIPDSRSLEPVMKDLEHAGFPNAILVTDRGYDTIRNLERYIAKGHPMIMCSKVSQKMILEKVTQFGEFNTRPEGMELDASARLYYKQYDMDYVISGTGNSIKSADRLKLNLYFDSVRRSEELMDLELRIMGQENDLAEMLENQTVCDDEDMLKKTFCYYIVRRERNSKVIVSYEKDEKKISKAGRLSGFFAIMTHKLDMSAMETFRSYRLRDEQEKYFQQMKGQMGADRQRCWSEDGKTGRLFILFVSMILSSHVRYTWKTTSLHDMFSSSLEVLDEMRPIRCIEHTGKARFITPFVGAQIDICEAFGFSIPDGCAPDYVSKQRPAKKRGRPRKPLSERDY